MKQTVNQQPPVECALHESEARLQAILDHSPAVMFVKDTRGRYLQVNRRFERLFQLRRDQLLGRTDEEIFPPEQAAAFRANDAKVLQAGEPLEFEEVARYYYGTHISIVYKFPLRDASGKVYALCGIATDITERKRMEENLKHSERRLAEAQQLAHVGNWNWEIANNLVTWSDELYRMYGLRPQEFKATYEGFLEQVYPDDREFVRSRIEQACRDHQPFTFFHRIVRPDGVTRTAHARGQVVVNAQGEPVRMFGTGQDVTERKQMEEKLRQAAERLQRLSRRLLEAQETERRLIARELHDGIGQSLTALQINLEAARRLRGAAALGAPLKECVSIVERVLQQVRDLSFDLRPSLLDDLGLASALKSYTHQQAKRGELCAVFRADPLENRLDPALETACFRVAQEALTNVVRHARAKKVTVELRQEDSTLYLTVRDDGIGFDVPAARQRDSGKASLGLLGMEERALLAGGRIEFKSTPQRGTEVHVWFPLSPCSPSATPDGRKEVP